MVELLGKSKAELRAFCVEMGEPAYRGGQIYHALYAERKFEFARMTNLPIALRKHLANQARITLPEVRQRYVSQDRSVRYLELAVAEPNRIPRGYLGQLVCHAWFPLRGSRERCTSRTRPSIARISRWQLGGSSYRGSAYARPSSEASARIRVRLRTCGIAPVGRAGRQA